MNRDKGPTGVRVLIGLTIFVAGIWGGSLVLDMFNPNYDPPATIGVVFMAIVSGLLGVIAASNRDGGKPDDKDKE